MFFTISSTLTFIIDSSINVPLDNLIFKYSTSLVFPSLTKYNIDDLTPVFKNSLSPNDIIFFKFKKNFVACSLNKYYICVVKISYLLAEYESFYF